MTEDHFLINMYVEAGRTNLMASASASAKRIEVRYAGGIIYVSPKDEEAFIRAICSYNVKVKVC